MESTRAGYRVDRTFIVKAGVLAALLATVFSALIIAILSAANPPQGGTTSPTLWEIGRTALLLCPITVVSCGSFGLLAGIAGSAVFQVRKRRIRTTKRLLVESSVAGFLLGFAFPFFDRLLNPPSLGSIYILLSGPIGVSCAVICGLTFRKHFVQR